MKKKLNHVRNLSYGIGASVLVAFVAPGFSPSNGWVVSLITILLVTLPLTLITVIVQNVISKRSTPIAEVKVDFEQVAEPAALANPVASNAEEVQDSESRSPKNYKNAGWVHLQIGLVVLTLAVVNLIIVQSQPLWTRMFAEPFWWIIAACSSVSFIIASTNFSRAKEFGSKQKEGESSNE